MNISQSLLALNTARRNTDPAFGGGLYCTDSQNLSLTQASFIKNTSQSTFGGSFSAGADIYNTSAVSTPYSVLEQQCVRPLWPNRHCQDILGKPWPVEQAIANGHAADMGAHEVQIVP